MARSIMKHTNVLNYLWGEAIRHSTYLLNRISTRAVTCACSSRHRTGFKGVPIVRATKPKNHEEEGERLLMCLNDEPRDFCEAKESTDWILACEDEIHSIIKDQTWNIVDLPDGVKPIGLKWVFKLKRNSDGSINKHKARLVAKGYVQ